MHLSDNELGKLNFDAYAKSKGGLTYDKKPIPRWEEVGSEVQTGWIEGALAVKAALGAAASDGAEGKQAYARSPGVEPW